MASSDARPVPRKNVAYQASFYLRDNINQLITGWINPSGFVSKDNGAFVKSSGVVTEIAGDAGCGYLDLLPVEMNADVVILKIEASNANTIPNVLIFYPEEIGDYRVDVRQISGEDVVLTDIISVSGIVETNVVQVSGDYVHIDNFKANVSSLPTAVQVRTELDANSLKLTAISGSVAGLAGAAMRGTDNAATYEQLTSVSGSILQANVVQVSGDYVHLDDFKADVSGLSTFNPDTTAVAISGIPTVNVVQIDGEDVMLTDIVSLSGIVDANILQVSGAYVHLEDFKADVSGLSTFDAAITAVAVSGISEVNVVQVSGEYVHLNDFGGGATTAEQVWQYANRNLTQAVSVSGIPTVNVVQVDGESVMLTDIVSLSGIIDANIVQVSGEYVSINDFNASSGVVDLTGIVQANVVQISGVPVGIDSGSVADSDELSVLGNLLIRNARIVRLIP